MGQDFHVYLHSDQQSTLASNTQPKEDSLGGAFKPSSMKKEILESSHTGFASLKKVGVVAGSALVAAKGVEKVLKVGFEHLSNYTGQYQYSIALNNFTTSISHVINPIGYVKQLVHRQFELNKQNDQIQLQSQLLGETVFATKKVGL